MVQIFYYLWKYVENLWKLGVLVSNNRNLWILCFNCTFTMAINVSFECCKLLPIHACLNPRWLLASDFLWRLHSIDYYYYCSTDSTTRKCNDATKRRDFYRIKDNSFTFQLVKFKAFPPLQKSLVNKCVENHQLTMTYLGPSSPHV